MTLSSLNRFGPWKRWHHYREWKKRRNAEPSRSHEKDARENTAGRLPDGEGVQVPGIWVAELYTPSTVKLLLSAIEKLGWEYGASRNNSVIEWMTEVRAGRSAGWINLGLVASREAEFLGAERTATLPPGVRGALPVLMSITPSLTAFIILFLFDGEAATSLEQPLRAEYQTTTRKDPLLKTWHVIRYVLMDVAIRFAYSIHSPDSIRHEAVKSQLQKLEELCTRWVREHLPGVFEFGASRHLPSAVLLVTDKNKPLTEETRWIRAMGGIGLNRAEDSWESTGWPGARMTVPHGWDDEAMRLVFACRRSDAFPVQPGYQDLESNWTIAQRAHEHIDKILSRWLITCLLNRYHETLATSRDQVAKDGGYRTIRDLKSLRSLARTTLYDIGACTQELLEFVQSEYDYRGEIPEIYYVRTRDSHKVDLLTNFRALQRSRAVQVQREANLLQGTLSTSHNITQIIANIQIQRLLVALTIISIGIAALGFVLTY